MLAGEGATKSFVQRNNTPKRHLEPAYLKAHLQSMELIYPINFVGHDEWMESGYSLEQSQGDVITRDGEVLGRWGVVNYDPENDDVGGKYQFIPDGQDSVLLSEEFANLDYRMSRGLALSALTRAIKEWCENQED